MNKKLMAVVLMIVVLIGAGLLYLVMRDKPASKPTAGTAQNRPAASSAPQQQPTQASAGRYASYDEQTVAAATGTKILFFHAAWCPQCRQLEADITAKQIPAGVTIFKVDYDSSQKLRQKYGVTLQTTLVKIDDSGNAVKKFVAYSEPTLDALIKNLL